MSRLLWSSSRSARMVLIGAAVALILVSVSLLVSTQSTGYYYQWQGEEVVVGFLQSLYNEYPAADDADLLLPGVDKNQAQRPVQHRPHTLASGNPIPSMSSDLYTNQRPQKQQQDVLNFVIFYADDWTWKTVGFVNNNDAVKTPHIDALARNGVAFTHNCVTSSICWQSRASMVTGVYTSVHQQLNYWDDRMFDTTVAWNQTLYPLLRQAGYHVGLVGKWHAPMPPQYMSSTFDHFKEYYGEHWMDRDGKRRHVTDVNREDALEYLNLIHQQNQKQQREHNRSGEAGMQQKFSLTVGFFATHAWDEQVYPNQYQPQEYSEPMYRNATIPIPASATQEAWDKMPWFFTEDNESRKRWRQRFDTPQHYQVTMKRMYRMASEVDDVVGDVVTKLQDMGVYNHTLLIFTTDNGIFHGEHGLADKWYPHEESIRVPLIIQDPRTSLHVRGTVNDEFTLNIDLAPTLLSAAGIPIPTHMQGRDMAELYLGNDTTQATEAAKSWRKDFFYEWSQGRPEDAKGHGNVSFIPAVYALVSKQYKYFYWPQTQYEQLFHVAIDPLEEHDIVNTTDPALRDSLRARYAWMKNLSQQGHRV